MDPNEQLRMFARIAAAFSPGAPIDRYALFAGRSRQVRDVLNAVGQRGQHVAIYGERGVGKTSLANVLSGIMDSTGSDSIQVGSINCDTGDTFASLWHKAFRELRVPVEQQPPGFNREAETGQLTLDSLLGENPGPEDVRYVLSRLGKTIIVIDELDRVREAHVSALLADTVKTLSDHSVNTTLLLVGVADSVDDLIREHRSVERALVQVRMPRMSRSELIEIVDRGLTTVGMTVHGKVPHEIAVLSQGLPHYTHLLALHTAQEAVGNGRLTIKAADLTNAITMAVEKAQHSIVSAHHRATSSPRKDNIFGRVLLACALARTDDLGYFAASDVRAPLSLIMQKKYDIPAFARHLNDFCEEHRGAVLQKTGSPRRFRFRFANPMMQPFVIMHGRAKGLIGSEAAASKDDIGDEP